MPERGTVFLAGGHESLRLFGEFVALLRIERPRLCVITTAAREPDRKLKQYRDFLEAHSVGPSEIHHADRSAAETDRSLMNCVEQADGVFFSGGGQGKLVKTLRGTALMNRILERHRSGLAIGGTSAGASAMSAVMIARSRSRSDRSSRTPHLGSGFGALPNIIVDQHFSERDRLARLVAAIAARPDQFGIGLDENTAATIRADGSVEISGTGRVTFVQAGATAPASTGWRSSGEPGIWARALGTGEMTAVPAASDFVSR